MKKFISIFIIIIFTITSTGCKESKQEINQMGIVLTSGFDLSPDGKYIITSQILNTQKGSSSASQQNAQQDSSEFTVFTSLGNTPVNATTNLSETYGKPLFFGHAKYIVLGEKLAKSGVSLLMDLVFRLRTARPDTVILVTKGKAADIIKAAVPDEKIQADKIENLVMFQSSKGYSPNISRLQFASVLLNKTGAPILGLINLKNEFNTDNVFDLSGTAVFKGDKLIGYMNINETRGMQWINGKVQSGTIAASLPTGDIVNFSILKSKSKIKPILKDGTLSMQINIKEEGNIIEMSAPLNPMENYKIMDELGTLQANAIKSEVLLALNAAQKQYKADVFGFGKIVSENYPDFWDKIKSNWPSIFPNLKIDVNVISEVKRPGTISKPMK